MQLVAAAGGGLVEVGAPVRCPRGHALGPGTMLFGFDSPDPAHSPRCRTVQCRACWARWFDGFGWI